MKVSKITRVPEGVVAGYGSYFGSRPLILFDSQAKLIIGKYTSIAAGFTAVLGGNHCLDHVTQYPFGRQGNPSTTKGNIVIGNDVWIGIGVTVLSGVTIGDGAVVGACSVVVKDVEPYEVVAGNPAKQIRFRFTYDEIQVLREIRWWDWEEDKIKEAAPLLFSSDITAFLEKYHG